MDQSSKRSPRAARRKLALLSGLAIVTISLGLARFAWPLLDNGAAAAVQPVLDKFKPSEAGTPVPEISFQDATGRTLSLKDFAGKVVMVNFWATWCGPCVEEMPSLNRLVNRFAAQGLAVVAISQDRGGLNTVQPFFIQQQLTALPLYLDKTTQSGAAFKLRGLPTTVILSREGKELGRIEGSVDWDGPAASKLLQTLLGSPAKPDTRPDRT